MSTLKRALLSIALVAAIAAAAAGAAAAAPVAPIPRVYSLVSATRFHHRRVLLVRTFEVYSVSSLQVRVSCNGCPRLRGRIRRSRPTPGAMLLRGVNWILRPGRQVAVLVSGSGVIGRYITLTSRLRPTVALIYAGEGCLATLKTVFGRDEPVRQACPRGIPAPRPGTPVPPPPPPPPPPPRAQPTLLTVSLAGTGSGTVSGTDISCPGPAVPDPYYGVVVCSQTYPERTVVSLIATPRPDSAFTGWSGACRGTGPCKIAMSSALTVTANFAVVNDGQIQSYDRLQPGAPYHGYFDWAAQSFQAKSNTITHIGVTVGNPAFPSAKPVPNGMWVQIDLCASPPDRNGKCARVLASARPTIVNYWNSQADFPSIAVTPGATYWVVWYQPTNGYQWVTYWWKTTNPSDPSNVAYSDQMQMIVTGFNR
jgi:hypothetical protein